MAKALSNLISGVVVLSMLGCSVIEEHGVEKVYDRNNRKLSLSGSDLGAGDVKVNVTVQQRGEGFGLQEVGASSGLVQAKCLDAAGAVFNVDVPLNGSISLNGTTMTNCDFSLKSLMVTGFSATAILYTAPAPYVPAAPGAGTPLTTTSGAGPATMYAAYVLPNALTRTLSSGVTVNIPVLLSSIAMGSGRTIAVQTAGAASVLMSVGGQTPSFDGGASATGQPGTSNSIYYVNCGVGGVPSACSSALLSANVAIVPTSQTTTLTALSAAFTSSPNHPISTPTLAGNQYSFVMAPPVVPAGVTSVSLVIKEGSGFLIWGLTGTCLGLAATCTQAQ